MFAELSNININGIMPKENSDLKLIKLSTFIQLQDMGKRTPSTSAIYETLRRSKELRESLSRPGSRMSVENIPEKLKEPVNSFL